MLTTLSTLVVTAALAHAGDTPNTLTKVEQATGWKLLFDGASTRGWREYKQPAFPAQGWDVADASLHHLPTGGGRDIVNDDPYADFELTLDFKCGSKANSGIMYRVREAADSPWMTGPEFQVLDDAGQGAKPSDPHSAGALYDIIAPPETKHFNAGDWNHARIRLHNGVLQHFLNGDKIAEVRAFDDDARPTRQWTDMIAASKFKGYEGFGVQPRGVFAIQGDHEGESWFRNIKCRDLAAPMPGEVSLFNGKDMTGWHPVLNDNGKPEEVWSVKDGVLSCTGNPNGYIRTEKEYKNYVIRLEWRFPGEPGNSGVLLRQVGEDKVWPKSVEAQLHSGNAGDFWNIDNVRMTVDPKRTNGRNTKKTHMAERPVGEWNDYEIVVNKGDIILCVNGEEVNRATDAEEVAGHICLQSEGAPIQFRRIRLVPLD